MGRKKEKISKTCPECGCTFEVYPSMVDRAKFCGNKCKYDNTKKRETESRFKISCDSCGAEMLRYNNRLVKTTNNFCNQKCHDDFRSKQVEHQCEHCNSTFKVKVSKHTNTRYCSMKCRNIAFNGENSPLFTRQIKFCRQCGEEFFANNYSPGKYCSNACRVESQKRDRPQDAQKFYSLPFWHKLRKECFERDGYECKRCGTTEKILHAHHIISRRAHGPDVLSNLISLCVSCHSIVEFETRKEGGDFD